MKVCLVMGKLFRRNIPSSANLVSLGDGGFAAVDGPALPPGLAGGGAGRPLRRPAAPQWIETFNRGYLR
ncbi:MAG: hypothetical protein LZF86_100107 [Nitrospira sp.]|nr:MAG: hypothetical protein LZF86_100107 [Nitrospira sp.]